MVLSAANVLNMCVADPFRDIVAITTISARARRRQRSPVHTASRGAPAGHSWEGPMARTQSNLSAANRELQQTLARSEPRIAASYALVGAILLFGGAGYA